MLRLLLTTGQSVGTNSFWTISISCGTICATNTNKLKLNFITLILVLLVQPGPPFVLYTT